jgi:hypothetical protein
MFEGISIESIIKLNSQSFGSNTLTFGAKVFQSFKVIIFFTSQPIVKTPDLVNVISFIGI